VGAFVGTHDGHSVGIPVGKLVGYIDGERVGNSVGAIVGFPVGSLEGFFVGFFVSSSLSSLLLFVMYFCIQAGTTAFTDIFSLTDKMPVVALPIPSIPAMLCSKDSLKDFVDTIFSIVFLYSMGSASDGKEIDNCAITEPALNSTVMKHSGISASIASFTLDAILSFIALSKSELAVTALKLTPKIVSLTDTAAPLLGTSFFVGAMLGKYVGTNVGKRVGILVGVPVGPIVGSAVGFPVGGVIVGEIVGGGYVGGIVGAIVAALAQIGAAAA
jgi:hypothetical protein